MPRHAATALALILGCVLLPLGTAEARDVVIESLEGSITPATVQFLSGTWCRNVDRIVHIRIAVEWPPGSVTAEIGGYRRLVFWTSEVEYIFPDGSYSFQHGSYIINGYFIARSGGVHQGVVSEAFERLDDSKVLLNPAVREVAVRKAGCK